MSFGFSLISKLHEVKLVIKNLPVCSRTMSSNSKQYGLILPQKANQGLVRDRHSIFNDSSESEEETGATDWVRKALKRESEKTFQKKQLDIQKALEEDPTVYQYDEVYDKIEVKKAEILNAKKQQDKKPRYIQSLLQQAEKRKREQERRNERIIQKEREAEGDKFKDKESFVTSAYRQKLEEFKVLEEEERRQDVIEALTDVSKQKDLSGFYRHLYRQTVSGEPDTTAVKQEEDEIVEKTIGNPDIVNEDPAIKCETEKKIENCTSPCGSNGSVDHSDKKNNSRQYRKRKNSSASSNSEDHDSSKQSKKLSIENIDADSDFSVDSDSSESGSDDSVKDKDQNDGGKERKVEAEKAASAVTVDNNSAHTKEDNENSVNVHTGKLKSTDDSSDTTNKKMREDKTGQIEEITSEIKVHIKDKKELVPKANIWIKRTVGEVLESALQRYYQRKASKLASKG